MSGKSHVAVPKVVHEQQDKVGAIGRGTAPGRVVGWCIAFCGKDSKENGSQKNRPETGARHGCKRIFFLWDDILRLAKDLSL
jgi:hypothetical protein